MKNNVVKNTTWLFIFQFAKIIFPFITLPYLTRVLTTDTYGVVTYVKTVMTYMQIFVDFGFVISGTKEIINCLKSKNQKNLGFVVGDTMIARIILGIIGYVVIVIVSLIIPILRENLLFTILSYTVVFESIFLMDFLFRGYEKMNVIAIRFILMKVLSTVLTFVLIKDDSNVMLIPMLDIISSLIAIMLVMYEVGKLNIKFDTTDIKNIWSKLKDSFVYFLSNVASTSFNALSTIIIGLYLSKAEIAYWGLCMQIVGTITALYNPISDGIYPEMIKTKNIFLIKRSLKAFMPIVIAGCIFAYFFAEMGFRILGGDNYLAAVPIFRMLIPMLFFGFPAILFGWPVLGAINRQKEVTITTILSVSFNILLLVLLIFTDSFTLINISIVRVTTEFVLLLSRLIYYFKNKNEFVKGELS
nr:oligosaccharide flippase family protein [Bacilli bacterium]